MRWMIRVATWCAPDPWAEAIEGDLWEEARDQPDPRRWLARQLVHCCWHGWAMRWRRAGVLEQAAATAFLFALPLALILATRTYALTRVPLRASSEFTAAGMTVVAASAWILGAARTRWAGGRGAAAWCGLAAAAIPVSIGADFRPWQLAVVVISAVAGSLLAARRSSQ